MENELITSGSVRADTPNPDDWTTAAGAAEILGCSRTAVYEMAMRGVLTRYDLCRAAGSYFWVPELREVAGARERLSL